MKSYFKRLWREVKDISGLSHGKSNNPSFISLYFHRFLINFDLFEDQSLCLWFRDQELVWEWEELTGDCEIFVPGLTILTC